MNLLNVIGIGGELGVGKSHLAHLATAYFRVPEYWLVSQAPLLRYEWHQLYRLVILGCRECGSDCLSPAASSVMAVAVKGWAADPAKAGARVFFEGRSLWNRLFLGPLVADPNVRLSLVCLTAPEHVLARRRRANGHRDGGPHVKGQKRSARAVGKAFGARFMPYTTRQQQDRALQYVRGLLGPPSPARA